MKTIILGDNAVAAVTIAATRLAAYEPLCVGFPGV